MRGMATDPRIGTRIQRRRQAMRMTQDELAGQLGVAKSTVANWETGKHFPKRHLGAVEAALGIRLTGDPDDSIEKLEQDVATSRDLTERQKQMLLSLIQGRDGQARHRVT